jgi:hypothetical protein
MIDINPIVRYGKPAVGISLGLFAVIGTILGLGGEPFRLAHGTEMAVLTAHWIIILYLCWLAYDVRQSTFSSPKLKKFYEDESLVLTEHKPWLGIGVSVSLFQNQSDGRERLICEGGVLNIQANGLVQIKLKASFLGVTTADIARHIQNDLSSIIVKPGLVGDSSD